jgi:nifR3 family TIM-barrel protein
MVEDLGFDAIDLNLGCPAKKVVKACGGSALLRETKLLEEILKTIRAATSLPFTIKIRAGWSETEIVSVHVGKMAEDIGINAIAFHPRTRVQGFSGHSDWNLIGELKAALKIPVIGNGDIVTPEDAFRMKRETGCDGVMIGRGTPSNPWIFRQIRNWRMAGTHTADVAAKYLIKGYFQLLFEEEPGAIGKMKQFASWFTCHPLRAALRKSILSSNRERSHASHEEFFHTALQTSQEDSELNVA